MKDKLDDTSKASHSILPEFSRVGSWSMTEAETEVGSYLEGAEEVKPKPGLRSGKNDDGPSLPKDSLLRRLLLKVVGDCWVALGRVPAVPEATTDPVPEVTAASEQLEITTAELVVARRALAAKEAALKAEMEEGALHKEAMAQAWHETAAARAELAVRTAEVKRLETTVETAMKGLDAAIAASNAAQASGVVVAKALVYALEGPRQRTGAGAGVGAGKGGKGGERRVVTH